MTIDELVKSQAKSLLADFDTGEELLSSPVAYAITGDEEELRKLEAVDFAKLTIKRFDASTPDMVGVHEWCETVRTDDGLAICFEEGLPYPLDVGDAARIAQSIN